MAADSISIMEAIREPELQASLFTTFNANLRFYEELILRRLLLSGSRNNVLVMDRRQCAEACASAATRPTVAGSLYTLVPVAVSGAFHPKICILAGKRRAHLFVGSHNLTISGFGYNRELSAAHRLVGSSRTATRDAIANAWHMVRRWIDQTDLPPALIESACRLDQVLGIEDRPTPGTDGALISQCQGSESLLDQLARAAPTGAFRITVLGAFFDSKGQFIAEVLKRWPAAEVVIAVDPRTVVFNELPNDSRLRIVDASGLGRGTDAGYLHAKAMYVESSSGDAMLAIGSANPSEPAWATGGRHVNTEAMLLRMGAAALEVATDLEIDRLSTLNALPEEALREVTARYRQEQKPVEATVTLLIGIATSDHGMIKLDRACAAAGGRVVAYNSQQFDMQVVGRWIDSATLHIEGALQDVRSLQVIEAGAVVARILVHHPQSIAEHIKRAGQQPTLDLVLSLGSDIDDISRVLPALERVIFAGDIGQALRSATQTDIPQREDAQAPRPDTLRVELGSTHGRPSKSLFAASHDLAYLIEILTRHIHVELAPARHVSHSTTLTEEEQIGQDDDEATSATSELRAADAEIGEVVCRRAAKLCRRMRLALQQADGAQEATATVVLQLVAVLALLQELHRLEQTDRWRRSRIHLFRLDDLEPLVDAALDQLFLGEMPVRTIWEAEPLTEVVHLVQLVLWAAWLVGYEWWSPTARLDPLAEVSAHVRINAKLLNLFILSVEAATWEPVRSDLERSAASDRQSLLAAIRWSERHAGVAGAVAKLCMEEVGTLPTQRTIVPGDLVDVPGVVDRLLVALDNDGSFVRVGSGGAGRRFDAARVRFRGTA